MTCTSDNFQWESARDSDPNERSLFGAKKDLFNLHVDLWNAVNKYVETCHGDTSSATMSSQRMDAVVSVGQAVEAIVKAHVDEENQKVDDDRIRDIIKGTVGGIGIFLLIMFCHFTITKIFFG